VSGGAGRGKARRAQESAALVAFRGAPCHDLPVVRSWPFLVACLLSIGGLPGCLEGERVVPEPVVPQVKGSEHCAAAEKNLLALGCEEGKPTKRGKSFTDFCVETQREGGIDLHPECLSTVKSCDEIDKVCAWNR
jgi:hypothetical protein